MKISGILRTATFFLNSRMRELAWGVALFVSLLPTSSGILHVFNPLSHDRDFSLGHVNIPLEEIFSGHSAHPDGDVIKHALRIIEQHYVQREKLDAVKMLMSGIRAVGREHGGDLEFGFVRPAVGERLQLSSQRTVKLCPSKTNESAEICKDSGVIPPLSMGRMDLDLNAVVRVGLRVFAVPLSVEPGFKYLDLVGRFILPEYARLKRVSASLVVHTFLNGLLDELDPHSSYMTQDEYRELRSGTRGQFGGVGLVIDESQELPVIREVVPNSPAHMAGVRPGDVLLRVGNSLSAFHPLENVLRDIRELSVDAVSPVWFYRPLSKRVYRTFLAREEIPTRSAELRMVHGRPDVLHVRVTGFSNHTAEDLYALYEHAQLLARGRLKIFVLDLRGNPGGLLDQAIQVSDLFIKSGQIVSTRSRFEEQVEQATRGVKIDLPVVVLMNSSSASASEIVAGALKDHGRALLVGERTFGKGSVQSLFELSTGTALKLTVAHYFTPRGRSLQGVGVEPHVNVKLVQPRDGYLWMSGSSELDREEHLVSHLSNPERNKKGILDAFAHLTSDIWVYSPPEPNVIGELRPIHFAYPLGDNIQTLLRLEEDPVARVGINLATALYGGRTSQFVFGEKQLKDTLRKIAIEEAHQLKRAVEVFGDSTAWKTVFKTFFEGGSTDDKGLSWIQKQKPKLSVLPAGRSSSEMPVFADGFRGLLRMFGVSEPSLRRSQSAGAGQLSLSAGSFVAWQSESQVLLTLTGNDLRFSGRMIAPGGLIGLRLDDLHDGPTIWLPVQFIRTNENLFIASVFLPKAVRTFLSGSSAVGQRPSVVGQIKWRLMDEGMGLGSLQLPPLARRRGGLEGHLVKRGSQHFLQMHFSRSAEFADGSGDLLGGTTNLRQLEVLVAPLTDERLRVVSDLVPLQQISDGEFIGETELKMTPVFQHGSGFGGVVGGVVRSVSGDVLATAPLLWVGDDGVFPIRTREEIRNIPLTPW